VLTYSLQVYRALYGRYLTEQWLPCLLLLFLTLTILPLMFRRRGSRVAGALLPAAWIWVGWMFHLNYFAGINFMAPFYAGLFLLQGCLLIWLGPLRGGLTPEIRDDLRGRIGWLVILLAWLVYPLADMLTGWPLAQVRLPGLAPGPTALFTLGMLLHCRDRWASVAMLIPAVWLLIAGFAGWVLGSPVDLMAPAPALLAVIAALATAKTMGRA
jgi:hypothetical protein